MRWPKYVYFNPWFRLRPRISEADHIFVVGAPRSGTTLVANVISNHSNVCSYPSESGIFSWRSCFVIFEGTANRNSYELHKLRRKYRSVVELFDCLAHECKAINKADRFLEKTPQHVFHIGFMLSRFTRARIVNVVRDPRDCYASARCNTKVMQNTPRKYARYWKRCVEARNELGVHDRIFDLEYEKFVADPVNMAMKLMRFVGEEFESAQIDPAVMKNDPRSGSPQFRHLGGNITMESVGRWRHELHLDEQRAIENVAGDLECEGLSGCIRCNHSRIDGR